MLTLSSQLCWPCHHSYADHLITVMLTKPSQLCWPSHHSYADHVTTVMLIRPSPENHHGERKDGSSPPSPPPPPPLSPLSAGAEGQNHAERGARALPAGARAYIGRQARYGFQIGRDSQAMRFWLLVGLAQWRHDRQCVWCGMIQHSAPSSVCDTMCDKLNC